MHNIEITMEIVKRKSFRLSLTDEEYEEYVSGVQPNFAKVEEMWTQTNTDGAWEEWDYAIEDLDNGKTIVEWD